MMNDELKSKQLYIHIHHSAFSIQHF